MTQPAAGQAAPRSVAPPAHPAAASPTPAGAPAAHQTGATRPARGVAHRVGQWLHASFDGTPGRMRLYGALVALGAVLFAVVAANTLWSSAVALDRANANTTQVVRVQSMYTDLLRADAVTSNGFLVGGLESADGLADYQASVGRVATTIAEAAQAQPADGAALAALNAHLQDYVTDVASARALNRQGLPVGAQYLRVAGTQMRAEALPVLQSLRDANEQRARDEFTASSNAIPLLLSALVALGALGALGWWLAQRTHRRLNPGVTVGAGLLLVGTLLGVLVLNGVRGTVASVRDTEFAGTLAVTTARSAAFDAKANESLGLIARGQASEYEQQWQGGSGVVTGQLAGLPALAGAGEEFPDSAQLGRSWEAYSSAHASVRALDDGGDWNAAVAAATGGEPGGSNATFDAFDSASAETQHAYQEATTDSLTSPRGWVIAAALLLLLAGGAAAVFVVRGVDRRLEEYR